MVLLSLAWLVVVAWKDELLEVLPCWGLVHAAQQSFEEIPETIPAQALHAIEARLVKRLLARPAPTMVADKDGQSSRDVVL